MNRGPWIGSMRLLLTRHVLRFGGRRSGHDARSPRLANNKGVALVLTLMVVALLTALVVEFAYGVYVSTSALHNWATSQKLSVAARSAVTLGSRLISENASQYPYTYPGLLDMVQKSPFEDLDGTIAVKIEDENAKFNLNTLGGLAAGFGTDKDKDPYNSFKRLLAALDLRPEIADRVSYWIDSTTEHRPSDGTGVSKDAPLDTIDELLLIPGIDQDTYERLRPYVTIYSDKRININSAEIPVLMSLSDAVTRQMADTIVRYRENTPFQNTAEISRVSGFGSVGTQLLGYIAVRSTAFRVTATAESGGIRRIIESVLDGSGRVVKYWKEI
jgi:general secretion pathway protein K